MKRHQQTCSRHAVISKHFIQYLKKWTVASAQICLTGIQKEAVQVSASTFKPLIVLTWLKIWSQKRPPLSKQRSLTYSMLYLQNTLRAVLLSPQGCVQVTTSLYASVTCCLLTFCSALQSHKQFLSGVHLRNTMAVHRQKCRVAAVQVRS